MTEQLVFVRHGQTVHNVAGIAQGWNDSALSDLGTKQVRRLAERIRRHKVDALYSSPLRRAMTTAEAIRDVTGLEIRPLDDLREMNYGRWEGQSFLDVRKKDAAIYEQWIRDDECPCPGGESHRDVLRRMDNAVRTIEGEGARRPAIVTHGTSLRIVATLLLAVPVTVGRNLAQQNASISVFVRREDRYVLKLWNDTSHCEVEGGHDASRTDR